MRTFLTLFLIFSFTLSVSAQQTKRSFIGKKEMKWLNSEVSTLEKNLTTLNKAHKNADDQLISNYKSRTISSINTLSTNAPIMLKSIQDFIKKDFEESNKNYISDEPRNVAYRSMSKKDFLEHIVLFDADIKKLLDNVKGMNDIKEEIDNNNYDFFASEEKSKQNIELTKKLLTLAKEFNSILQKSKV